MLSDHINGHGVTCCNMLRYYNIDSTNTITSDSQTERERGGGVREEGKTIEATHVLQKLFLNFLPNVTHSKECCSIRKSLLSNFMARPLYDSNDINFNI